MNKFQKILNTVTTLSITGHEYAAQVRQLIKSGDWSVVDNCATDWDFDDIESTRAYQDGVGITVTQGADTNDVCIIMSVYAGSSLTGQREELSHQFQFDGAWWKILGMQRAAEQAWVRYTNCVIDQEDFARKEARRISVSNQLLNGTY